MFHESKTDLGSRRLCLKEGPFFSRLFFKVRPKEERRYYGRRIGGKDREKEKSSRSSFRSSFGETICSLSRKALLSAARVANSLRWNRSFAFDVVK